MSKTVIIETIKFESVLVDPTSVKLSSIDGSYGVRRTDDLAVVVADGTAMTKVSTGVYSHTFTDPADGLTYEFTLEIVYAGVTTHINGNITGGTDGSTNLYGLLPRIEPQLKGLITSQFIKQQLRSVAEDFMRATEIWKEDLAAITSVADQSIYTLSAGAWVATIARVNEVTYDGTEVGFKEVSSDGLTLTLSSATPAAGKDIVASVILIPKPALTSLPAWVLDRWSKPLVDGAIWMIKKMPKKTWSDRDGAAEARADYVLNIGRARAERIAQRGPTKATRVRLRKFV